MRRRFSPTRDMPTEYTHYNDRVSPQLSSPLISDDLRFFCHYNNAVYMGGMLSSQKHGKGLILHDDGATVVSEYYHDAPSGHNIIFRDNSITSILFRSSVDYEIAYKMDKFIMKIPFSGNSHRANGIGCLINYQTDKLFEIVFQDGAIVEKVLQLEHRSNEDIFRRNTITRTIGVKHEQAFQLTFERPHNMHVKYDHNQLIIGYYNERGEVHGLAAKIYAENTEVSGHKSLYLKTIERGYYRNSQLSTFGEKYFSNGNHYVGEFEGGQYEGNGILVCPQQMKWVYGVFVDGKLANVIDSNNERHTENDFQMWMDSLWDIHKRYSERWIDLNIELPDELYLYRILKDAIEMQVTHIDPDREESLREGEKRLNKIQHQFIEGYPGNVERSYVDQELDRHYDDVEYGTRTHKYSKTEDSWSRPQIQQDYTYKFRVKDNLTNHYQQNYAKRPLEDYYPDYKYYKDSTSRRRPRYYDDIASRYSEYEPVDSIYRRTYFDSLQRRRDNLKRLEATDKHYLRNLREQLAKSPVHRNHYSTPPKDPDRYKERAINKRYFNYKDPNAAYVHRWPQSYNTSRQSPTYYDKNKGHEQYYQSF